MLLYHTNIVHSQLHDASMDVIGQLSALSGAKREEVDAIKAR